MQKFLGKALEARGSCNCAICSPIGPGLTRNANNTLPAKRRLKFSDVINVVYGTIIGTAALYDGTVKNNRRRAVDTALLGLLQENEAVIQNQEARLRALGYEGSESEATLSEHVARSSSDGSLLSWNTIARRPSLLKPTSLHLRRYSIRYLNHQERCDRNSQGWWQAEMQTVQEERVLNRLRASSNLERYEDNTRHRTKDKKVVEPHSASLLEARFVGKTIEKAWEDLTLIPNERTWQIRETGVAQLVLKLLKTYLTSVNTERDNPPSIRLRSSRRHESTFNLEDIPRIMQLHSDLTQRIEDLKLGREVPDLTELIEHLPFPRFSNYRRHEGIESFYHSDVRELNDEIASIFVQATNSADLISRLCSLLISCPTGPDIHTMNLLLVLFLDIQWYQACKAIIQAVSTMAMNHNEITDVAQLQFYHLTQQDMNIDARRAIMLGIDGRATRAAFQPGNLTTEVYHPEQVVPKLTSRNGEPKWLLGLKAGWTAEAFSVVIIDLLDRGNLLEARTEIGIMQLSGFQETPDVLEALLQYSVFKQDWDLALETWARFDDLGHGRSVLIWYWMLQACVSCRQSDSFYHFATTGQQLGILDPSTEYIFGAFMLTPYDQDRLKLRVHALRRLRFRLGVPVPRLPQRDLVIQEDDIIQMPNLQKTTLMVYLQYAKLQNATCTWFVDHLGYLYDAETQFEYIVGAPSATPQLLQHIKVKWASYNAKLEAFESRLHGQSIIKGVNRGLASEQADLKDGTNISVAVPAHPVGSRELLASLGYSRIAAGPKTVFLEVSDQSDPQQTKSRNSWSSQKSGADDLDTTTPVHVLEHRWHHIQHHELADEARPVSIRYKKNSTPSVTPRRVFARVNDYKAVAAESLKLRDDAAGLTPPTIEGVAWQTPGDYTVSRPASARPRVYNQHDNEADDVFEQDLRLVAAAG